MISVADLGCGWSGDKITRAIRATRAARATWPETPGVSE